MKSKTIYDRPIKFFAKIARSAYLIKHTPKYVPMKHPFGPSQCEYSLEEIYGMIIDRIRLMSLNKLNAAVYVETEGTNIETYYIAMTDRSCNTMVMVAIWDAVNGHIVHFELMSDEFSASDAMKEALGIIARSREVSI